jgi:predicted TIM-barrel fold metal-dependent hydrolase
VIDLHHHMFAPDLTAALSEAGVDRIGGEPLPPWSPEASLDLMDRYGIDVAILSTPVPLQFAAPEQRRQLARAINDFGHACTRRWPDRFGFFATLPLPDVEPAVDEARRALDELGADGVALLTNHAGIYQGDARLDPLYAELDQRSTVGFVHPTVAVGAAMPLGHDGSPVAGIQPSLLEFAFDTTRAIANLVISGVPERFPQLRFVLTHCGGCAASVASRLIDRRPLVAAYTTMMSQGKEPSLGTLEAMMADAQHTALRRLGTLYYDIALSTDAHLLDALTAIVSPSCLVLGTDYPMGQEIGVHVTLTGLDRSDALTDAQRQDIRSANPARAIPRLARAQLHRTT